MTDQDTSTSEPDQTHFYGDGCPEHPAAPHCTSMGHEAVDAVAVVHLYDCDCGDRRSCAGHPYCKECVTSLGRDSENVVGEWSVSAKSAADPASAALKRAHALLSWIDGACVDELPHSEIAAAISRYHGEGET